MFRGLRFRQLFHTFAAHLLESLGNILELSESGDYGKENESYYNIMGCTYKFYLRFTLVNPQAPILGLIVSLK